MLGFDSQVIKYIGELKNHQYRGKEFQKRVQQKKLRRIIDHAYRNVPFYHDLFKKNNIRPEDIRGVDDLQKIPITRKKDIRDSPMAFISKSYNLSELKVIKTSGTTGEPVQIRIDRNSRRYSTATFWYALFEIGHKPRYDLINISAAEHERSNRGFVSELFHQARLFKTDSIFLCQQPRQIIRDMDRPFPYSLFSYPSVLEYMSSSIEGGTKLPRGPKIIISHGETLLDDIKYKIESAFQCKVFNTFGSTEFQRLAFECEKRMGYHMITDGTVIEFTDKDEVVGQGEPGEVVVTSLYNYTMPLIRYSLDDIGVATERTCSCGRTWPLIETIEGRVDDFLILPSGLRIPPRNVNNFRGIPGFLRYIIVQERGDKFLVIMVPSKEFSKDTENRMRECIKLGCLGEQIDVEFELVDEIPRELSGKLRKTVSKVHGH